MSNQMKTLGLFVVMWMLILAVGAALSAHFQSSAWILGAAVFGIAMNIFTYWNSASLALRSMNAVPASVEQYPELHAMVAELAQRAGQPVPKLYIAPTMTPNAFATGRNPEHAAVCCTQGIMQLLNQRELRAVLGHELMHVYNRDILTSTIASGMAGVITSIAQMMMFMGGSRDGNGRSSAIASLLMVLLAPLAATLIQLSISRTREFEADHDGAILSGDPLALASALRRLEVGNQAMPLEPTPARQNTAAMMIANPFASGVKQFFSTHPPMRERIARLEQMAGGGIQRP